MEVNKNKGDNRLSKQVADALVRVLESANESDRNLEPANVVDGLFAIARALSSVAKSIQDLGVGDAATPMGAMEFLAKEVRDGFDRLSASIQDASLN